MAVFLDKYISDQQSIQGLTSMLKPYFHDQDISPPAALNGLRQILERLLFHLSTLSGVEDKGMASRIDKLEAVGIIDRQISPYFHSWWKIACLGSHFQQNDVSDIVTWKEHLDYCRQAVGICIAWYIKKFPSLSLTRAEQQLWLKDASTTFTVPFKHIQVCNKPDIEHQIILRSILVLYGQPWVGKTSIASYWVTEFCSQGYIPIVIHENSLVTFRILPEDDGAENPKNLRHAVNAQRIHEIVCTRLIHGDSFVVFLDDPFGHRRFQKQGPLALLRIAEWLNLASDPLTLGNIKVIITSPDVFLEQGRKAMLESAVSSKVSRENLSLLDGKNQVKIDVDMYSSKQIQKIVQYTAEHNHCNWSYKFDSVELVAEVLKIDRLGFDALRFFCREHKMSSESDLLDQICNLTKSANIQDKIQGLTFKAKVMLCAAYIGETLIEFYREFMFFTKLSFLDICAASEQEILMETGDVASLDDWLIEDGVATFNLSSLPVFSHPEIRFAVGNLVEGEMYSILQTLLGNLTGLSVEYKGKTLARWEAVHLICRFANFVTPEQAQFIHDHYFYRSEVGGGDPRNILWAILGNWKYIEQTNLDKSVRGFLKSLTSNFREHIRLFIQEATGNWIDLDQEIRSFVLSLSGRGDSLDKMEPTFNPHNTVSFLVSGVTNYSIIQDCARAGCKVSEKYIEFISALTVQIAQGQRKNFYTSRMGDELFNSPGSQYGSEEILKRLVSLGRRRGTLDDEHPLVLQINKLLG